MLPRGLPKAPHAGKRSRVTPGPPRHHVQPQAAPLQQHPSPSCLPTPLPQRSRQLRPRRCLPAGPGAGHPARRCPPRARGSLPASSRQHRAAAPRRRARYRSPRLPGGRHGPVRPGTAPPPARAAPQATEGREEAPVPPKHPRGREKAAGERPRGGLTGSSRGY